MLGLSLAKLLLILVCFASIPSLARLPQAPPGTGQEAWLQGVSITLQSGTGVDLASCGAGVSAAAPRDRITLHCQRITGSVDRVVVRRPASAAPVPLAFSGLDLYADGEPLGGLLE